MTYRELQTALKAFRSQGLDVQVKLTASFDTLQTEYYRLSAITSLSYANAQLASPEPPSQQLEQPQVQPQEGLVMTTDSFNEWVGLPYEQTSEPVVDITSVQVVEPNQDTPQARPIEYIQELAIPAIAPEPEEPTEKASSFSEPINNVGKLPSKQHEALQGNSLYITSEPITPITKQPSNSPQDCQGYDQVKDVGLRANSSDWIDGTELGQNLNHTQAQALRNLEDGVNWLRSLAGKLKAFESGFREGWRNTPVKQQARLKQSNVIPIERSHRLPKPLPIPLVA